MTAVDVLLFEGPLANKVVTLDEDVVLSGHYRFEGTDYELGQLYYHDHSRMYVTWVGRPPGTRPTIKLALDVAVTLMKLLRR